MSTTPAACSPLLLLFDIDGTLLLGAAEAHALAMHAALREVYGLAHPQRPRVGPAGRTDLEIARLIALEEGVSARRFEERLGELRDWIARDYASRVPADLSHTVAPGMEALLDELDARDDVRAALLTGNLETVARLKLRAAGLQRHFPAGQGAFGSDSEDRTRLPQIARRRAGDHPRARTVVIGDTPRDIACARVDGVRCLAVASGRHPPDELADADAVARDAHELAAMLRTLG